MSTNEGSIEEVLRQRLATDPDSYYAIARATGITHPTRMRFAKGEGSLRLSVAAKLAEHYRLGIRGEITPRIDTPGPPTAEPKREAVRGRRRPAQQAAPRSARCARPSILRPAARLDRGSLRPRSTGPPDRGGRGIT